MLSPLLGHQAFDITWSLDGGEHLVYCAGVGKAFSQACSIEQFGSQAQGSISVRFRGHF